MATLIDYMQAKALLDSYGIRSAESAYLDSADAAVRFSAGGPIALKALTDKALHKTKSGLIATWLSNDAQVRVSFDEISRKASVFKPYRMLGQRMVKGGLEIIVGGSTDAQFGKMILVGLGGIYVETFRDFAMRVCPITRTDAGLMIDQLRSGGVIAPDEKSRDVLMDLLVSASRMFAENDMSELDLNPIILHDGTYDAVDIRMLR